MYLLFLLTASLECMQPSFVFRPDGDRMWSRHDLISSYVYWIMVYQQRKFVSSNSLPPGSQSDNPLQAASHYSKIQEPLRVSSPHNWLQFPLKKTPMIYFDHDSLNEYTVNKENLKHSLNFMYRLAWLPKAPTFECIGGFRMIFMHRIKQFFFVLEKKWVFFEAETECLRTSSSKSYNLTNVYDKTSLI
jgi:hypothetical protein